jgi:translation initiation factor 1
MPNPDPRYKLIYTDEPPRRAPGNGKARVRLERSGRMGKTVTWVDVLALSQDQMRTLLRDLQHACGTGGTSKENHLELQGDCREKVCALLRLRGYKV